MSNGLAVSLRRWNRADKNLFPLGHFKPYVDLNTTAEHAYETLLAAAEQPSGSPKKWPT
jgi:hypothetical protein